MSPYPLVVDLPAPQPGEVEGQELAGWPTGRLLALAGRLVTARFHRCVEEEGLTAAGMQVLDLLVRRGERTQGEVAAAIYVSPGTVTGVVDTLERDGHVARRRDCQDRRVVRVAVTSAGRGHLEAARRHVEQEITPAFRGMDPEQERHVRDFLLATITTMARLDEPPLPG